MTIQAEECSSPSPVRPRRFEPGASGIDWEEFMRKAGWEISRTAGRHLFKVKRTGTPGRPQKLTRTEVMELLDQERLKRGLVTIAPPWGARK